MTAQQQTGWSKQDWKYKQAAQDFRSRHGNPLYTMQWHARLEHIYEDPELPVLMRYSAFVDRHAPGNLSDCVVDAMPRIDQGDPIPRRLSKTEIASRLHVSPAAISACSKTMEEHALLQPDTGDGIWINHCIEGELFEAAHRAGSSVSPFDATHNSGVENDSIPDFATFKTAWLAQHPDHAAAKSRMIQARENLRMEVRDLTADIKELDLLELAAYRTMCREIERNARARNGDSHSANGNGACAAGAETDSTHPATGSIIRLPVETLHGSTPAEVLKSNVFNEGADISFKEGTVASSSSVRSVTDSAETTTTTPVHTPSTPKPGVETGSEILAAPESVPTSNSPSDLQTPSSLPTDVEFSAALARAFANEHKPVPNHGQALVTYVDLGLQSARFLEWLDKPYREGQRPLPPKLRGIQHPGALPALVQEFRIWLATAPAAPPGGLTPVLFQGVWRCGYCREHGPRPIFTGNTWRCEQCGRSGSTDGM